MNKLFGTVVLLGTCSLTTFGDDNLERLAKMREPVQFPPEQGTAKQASILRLKLLLQNIEFTHRSMADIFGELKELALSFSIEEAEEARALAQKGMVLAVQKNHGALARFDECVERFKHNKNSLVREQVATALVERGWWHLVKGNNQDLALEDFQECVRLYQNDPNPNAREQAARAYERLHVILYCAGKLEEVKKVLEEAAKGGNFAETLGKLWGRLLTIDI